MKELAKQDKDSIRDALKEYFSNSHSQNRAGENLSGERWTLTESSAFSRITFAMADAQTYKNTTWIVGDAGCGKTTAAIEYCCAHRNVFYLLCSEDMKKSDFVREIARQVGAPPTEPT